MQLLHSRSASLFSHMQKSDFFVMMFILFRGDIVTVLKPVEPDHVLCKRIVAVAGEKITKDNGDTIQVSLS